MIENVLTREALRSHCRRNFKRTESRTVSHDEAAALASEGWLPVKKGKTGTRVERAKPHSKDLEDRVWSLFYRMGFPLMSGEGGAKVVINGGNANELSNQLDCVAVDNEVALGVECKSSKEYGKRARLQEEIAKLSGLKNPFARGVANLTGDEVKRATIMCMFLVNATLTEVDHARAKEAGVTLFDDTDLDYYEKLVSHLGPAARFQFLADLLPGKEIPGLKIRLAAIKLKMGGGDAYMFAISPEYLLKIGYVSHRAKGKGSDIDTYQRMMKRSRLKKIREFIEDKGTFPTNIVVNVDSRRLTFFQSKQDAGGAGETDSGILGWLDIKPAYKSAWIIDGQHRLFGYSGSKLAAKSRLAVLAFAGLKPNEQAGMFISINSKQKSVKQSLLQELYSELHWEAEDPRMRVRAVISKAIQYLDSDKGSPFFGKIQTADSRRDETRCISLTAVYGALDKSGLYIASEKGGEVTEYGALWEPTNEQTLKRTAAILNHWFQAVANAAPEWWALGSGEGGGLSMNDGIVSIIGVLRAVLLHLRDQKHLRLADLSTAELLDVLEPYTKVTAAYIGSLNAEDRKKFREGRGIQGVTTRQRRIQQAIRAKIADFNPPGLDEFLQAEKAESNKKAKELLDEIELIVRDTVLNELRAQYGSEDTGWWYRGVPGAVRKDVTARMEEDANKRGGKEFYFNFIHYRSVINSNWSLFDKTLGYSEGKKAVGKEKGTEWMQELNDIRNGVAHVTSGRQVTMEELALITRYRDWVRDKVENPDDEFGEPVDEERAEA